MSYKSIVLLLLILAFAVAGSASAAVVITVDTYDTEAAAKQALDSWAGASLVPDLLETFEGFAPEVPVGGTALGFTPTDGQPLYTSFGQSQFYVEDDALPGGGVMRFQEAANFGVMERDVVPFNNRGRTLNWKNTDSWFGSQYLDSGDVSKISLNSNLADLRLSSLFFFMFDVSDIDGKMMVRMGGEDIYMVDGLGNPQANGLITFFGIQADDGDYISKITWEMDTDNDGFGLDNFGTLNPVPLPASILLLGSGLLGLGFVRRKKTK